MAKNNNIHSNRHPNAVAGAKPIRINCPTTRVLRVYCGGVVFLECYASWIDSDEDQLMLIESTDSVN